MRAIAVYTETGTTARLISKYRPRCPVYAFASNAPVCARLNLMWGVQPLLCEIDRQTEDMVAKAESILLKKDAVTPGDVVAVVAGTRTTTGSTNFMRLHVIGSADGRRPGSHTSERRKTPRLKPTGERRRK